MKKIILAVAIAALASVSVIAFASAGVQRNQPTGTLTVTLPGIPGNVHTYTLNTNCDGSFTGTGSGTWQAGSPTETITGSLVDGNLTFKATYFGAFAPGYFYSYDGPLTGGNATDSIGQTLPITATFAAITTYANHGAYVSANHNVDDAAHSCIGMPIGA